MARKRALLIGASDYDAPGIAPLPFIPDDMAALGEALERRGFEVSIPRPKRQVGTTFVNVEMGRFLRRARAGDSLLACFSGHGVHAEGQDYFVPEDAHLELEPFEQGCVAIDWKRDLERSLAEHIVILVDACREGIERDSQGLTGLTSWGRRKVDRELRRKVAYVYACSPGQLARFVTPGDQVRDGVDCGTRPGESFSLFSRAVRDVLLRHPGALDLGGFKENVQDRIEDLHRGYGKMSHLQQLRVVVYAAGDQGEFPIVDPLPGVGAEPVPHPSPGASAGPVAAAAVVSDTMSAVAEPEVEPGVRLARALYRFQLHHETEPLLDFAATGPARDVVQLADVVPAPVQEQIWDACALLRPGPAWCELRRALHRAGRPEIEQRVLETALRSRLPDELFLGMAADDVHDVLTRAARTYDAPATVKLVESLHGHGLGQEAGQLLYAAVREATDALPPLLAALRSAGLMRGAERVLTHCGLHHPARLLPGLVAALEAAGSGTADHGRLLTAIAARPTASLLRCLADLRTDGRGEDALGVLARAAARGPAEVARLVQALLDSGADSDAALVLDTAAGCLSVPRLTDLVRLLHQDASDGGAASLVLLQAAVRRRGFTDFVRLVRELAARWLDREARTALAVWTRLRPPDELPPLVSALSRSGHDVEAGHLLATVATRRSPRAVATAYAALRRAELPSQARRLVALVLGQRPDDDLPAVLQALCEAGAGTEIHSLVSAVALDPYRSAFDVVPVLLAISAAGLDCHAVTESAALRRPAADLPLLLRALREGGADTLLRQLRQAVAAGRPAEAFSDLVLTLHATGEAAELRALLGIAATLRPSGDLPVLISTLYENEATEAAQTLRNAAAHSLPAVQLSALVVSLVRNGRTRDVDALLPLVSEQRPVDVVVSLVGELNAAGIPKTAEHLTLHAVELRPLADIAALVTSLRTAGLDIAADRALAALGTGRPSAQTIDAVRALRGGRRDDMPELLRGAVLSRKAGAVRLLVEALREAGLADEARMTVVVAAETCDPDSLGRLVGKLNGAGLRDDVMLAADVAAEFRPITDVTDILYVLFGFGLQDAAHRLLFTATRRRGAADLVLLLSRLDDESAPRGWALDSVGQRSPVATMAKVVQTLLARGRAEDARRILFTAFDARPPTGLPPLLRKLGMTEYGPASTHGSASELTASAWKAFESVLPRRSLTLVMGWEHVLHDARLDEAASVVLSHAAQRPAKELTRVLSAPESGKWEAGGRRLMERVAQTGRLGQVLEEWRAEASPSDFQNALDQAAEYLLLGTLAVGSSPHRDLQVWAMQRCPVEELVPALAEAVRKSYHLEPGVLELLAVHRQPGDVVRLVDDLLAGGLAGQAQSLLTDIGLWYPPEAVAALLQELDTARAREDIGHVIAGIATPEAKAGRTPAQVILALHRRGLSSYDDEILNAVAEDPGNHGRLPGYARDLFLAGLSAEADLTVTRYLERCPDSKLVAAFKEMGAPGLPRLWVSRHAHFVAATRTLPVIREVLLALCAEGHFGWASRLMFSVRQLRSAQEAAELDLALAASGHRTHLDNAGTLNVAPDAPRRRAFSKFRRGD
ncbi:caspase family protein [Streptomyces sp. R35]|uniref:Caspase family protein n=1 Tax=Streptomyces sp. R35 TaxID=3238630 RepID=A0AB39SHE0_9ACTN